jgi:hypothetical protein
MFSAVEKPRGVVNRSKVSVLLVALRGVVAALVAIYPGAVALKFGR